MIDQLQLGNHVQERLFNMWDVKKHNGIIFSNNYSNFNL